MISQEKWITLTYFQKLPINVRDLDKLIVSKGFKKLPKVQKIAQSGHTRWNRWKRGLVCVDRFGRLFHTGYLEGACLASPYKRFYPVVKVVFCFKIRLVLIFCDTLDQNRLDHLKIYPQKKCLFFKMKRLRLKLQMMHPLEKLYGLFLHVSMHKRFFFSTQATFFAS